MQEVALDLDPAMVDNMRREAETHGFDDLDGYVQWLLERRDTVLNEENVWEDPPGVSDPDADLSQSSGGSLEASGFESKTPDDEASEAEQTEAEPDDEEDEDVELPEDDGADDDDVAAALEEIELDDEE